MARLTSLTSVLAALELPEDGARARSRGPDAGPPAPAGVRTAAYGEPAGFRTWQNARDQAQFYVAYAEMLEPAQRSRRPRRRARAARRPVDEGDTWVREAYPEGHWVGPATLASSYRQAAQYAALVDPAWATKLAARAAMAYVSSGLPFGLFLATGLLDDETLSDGAAHRTIVEPFRDPAVSEAVRHPVQLTYLLLAASSRPWLRDPLQQTLSEARDRLAAHSLYAIGPQGVPLGDYVDLADAVGDGDDPAWVGGSAASLTEVAGLLAGLQRTQAKALRVAQRNRFMWHHGASVIDLENVALSGLALRRHPWFRELSAAVSAQLARDDALAELPLWAMGEIETGLPGIADSVTGIIREPEDAWRREDFLVPETVADPWTEESSRDAGRRQAARRAEEETQPPVSPTRPDYPVTRRDDAAPGARPGFDQGIQPYEYPGPGPEEYPPPQLYGADDSPRYPGDEERYEGDEERYPGDETRYEGDEDEGGDGDDPYFRG